MSQISPDGKFYWDGQSWRPMPQQSRGMPCVTRTGCTIIFFVLLALIIGGFIIGLTSK